MLTKEEKEFIQMMKKIEIPVEVTVMISQRLESPKNHQKMIDWMKSSKETKVSPIYRKMLEIIGKKQ